MDEKYNRGKKFFIGTFIDRIYAEHGHLFNEDIEKYRSAAIDKYANSAMTYDTIADDIIDYLMDKRKSDIANIAKNIYIENESLFAETIDAFTQNVVNEYFKSNMRISEIDEAMRERIAKIYREIEEKAKNKHNQEESSEAREEQPIEVREEQPTEVREQQPNEVREQAKNNLSNAITNSVVGTTIIGAAVIGQLSNNTLKFKNSSMREIGNFQKKLDANNKPNELNSMLNEPITRTNKPLETTVNKVFVKKDNAPTSNNNSNQAGSISIFNISLVILIITGLILIALILNVLLK